MKTLSAMYVNQSTTFVNRNRYLSFCCYCGSKANKFKILIDCNFLLTDIKL